MNPERIGRYEIVRPLGRGAMGVVYLARDPQIERELALKTIRFDSAEKGFNETEAKARFLKEARISGRLQHPYIVTVFDVGEDRGNLFLAMEYVPGGSLSQRLADPNALSIFDRIRIVAEVAEALGHAHERGVLHRDVKPANILLTPGLTAKVSDFGIGKLLSGDTDLTTTGQMVGSPAYMSPEQIRGEKLDSRSDIFSLGVVLYQALTLRKPFPADTLTTLVYQILNEEPADPRLLSKDLPPEIGGIVRRCLAKKRTDRYTDAAELAAELRNALGYSPVVSTAGLSESDVKRAPAATAMTTQPTVGPATVPMPPPSDADSPTITTGRAMGPHLPREAKTGGRTPLVIAGAILLAALVGTAVVMSRRKEEAKVPVAPAPPPTAAAAPSPATSSPGAAAPSTAANIVETPAQASATAAAIRVVETPLAVSPSPVPTRRARARPTAGPETAAAAPSVQATPPPSPQRNADYSYVVRRFVKINVSPSQARVFLDGKYIGISDDWDGSGGGALLAFNMEGNHRLRFAYPGYRDLRIELSVRASATQEKVEIEPEMQKGAPEGPTGPEGKIHRPNYKTVRAVIFNVEPPDAIVAVNGRELGPASRWAKEEMIFADMAVYDITLTAPDYEPKALRLIVAPTTGEARAVIKERLKKEK